MFLYLNKKKVIYREDTRGFVAEILRVDLYSATVLSCNWDVRLQKNKKNKQAYEDKWKV